MSLTPAPTPKALVLLYKGVLNVMMVVGGRVHTGSFDREMSKCVRLCVSVTICVCRCLALRGQRADVMSVRVCVRAYVMSFWDRHGSRWASDAATALRGWHGCSVGVDSLHHRFCMIKPQRLIPMRK